MRGSAWLILWGAAEKEMLEPVPYTSVRESMKLDRLNHIGVAVRDIEKTKDFLKKNFEAEIIHEMVSEGQGFRSTLVSLGELNFELMAPIENGGIVSEFINQRG